MGTSAVSHAGFPRQELRLASGKRISFVEYGNPQGDPVILLHGTPGSARYWGGFPDVPRSNRWRFIAVDRPGYGHSEFWRHGYASLAPALKELADHLSLGHVTVLGVSAGGGYALAAGAMLATMADKVIAVSSTAPFDARLLAKVNRTNRIAYWIARKLPVLNRLNAWLIARLCRKRMEQLLDRGAAKLSRPDRRDLEDPQVRAVLIAAGRDAYPTGSCRGLAQDIRNQVKPWDFDPGSIAAETHIWTGDDDNSTPIEMAHRLHALVRHGHLHVVPESGHLWHILNLGAILERSRTDAGGRRREERPKVAGKEADHSAI